MYVKLTRLEYTDNSLEETYHIVRLCKLQNLFRLYKNRVWLL